MEKIAKSFSRKGRLGLAMARDGWLRLFSLALKEGLAKRLGQDVAGWEIGVSMFIG